MMDAVHLQGFGSTMVLVTWTGRDSDACWLVVNDEREDGEIEGRPRQSQEVDSFVKKFKI